MAIGNQRIGRPLGDSFVFSRAKIRAKGRLECDVKRGKLGERNGAILSLSRKQQNDRFRAKGKVKGQSKGKNKGQARETENERGQYLSRKQKNGRFRVKGQSKGQARETWRRKGGAILGLSRKQKTIEKRNSALIEESPINGSVSALSKRTKSQSSIATPRRRRRRAKITH